MKRTIKATKLVEVPELITVELPYYYKGDFYYESRDVVVYGRLTELAHLRIEIETNLFWGDSDTVARAEINEVKCKQDGNLYLSDIDARYFSDVYESNEAEFLEAKAKVIKLIEGA